MRPLRFALATLFLLLSSMPAWAQAAPTAVGPGTSVKVGGAYSIYHLQYGERWLGGGQVWVDANMFWRTGLEVEGRQLQQNQDLNTHASTYLVGPRLSIRPGRIEPYAKFLVGMGKLSFPYSDAHGSYFVAAAGGGVDLHISNRVQIRAIDLQYQRWPTFTFGSLSSYGVSTGLSVTVYRGKSWLSE